jgi:hypothetical protein
MVRLAINQQPVILLLFTTERWLMLLLQKPDVDLHDFWWMRNVDLLLGRGS